MAWKKKDRFLDGSSDDNDDANTVNLDKPKKRKPEKVKSLGEIGGSGIPRACGGRYHQTQEDRKSRDDRSDWREIFRGTFNPFGTTSVELLRSYNWRRNELAEGAPLRVRLFVLIIYFWPRNSHLIPAFCLM
jgi:hypothetical protein